MTILSAQSIREMGILTPCSEPYRDPEGNSAGLSACGYDLTLGEDVKLWPGTFCLASAAEHFSLPHDIVGIIHDKSSLARRGLAVQNTVAEPGWRGYLTLELTNHGQEVIQLRRGSAICQVIFHTLDKVTELPYQGKYQDQPKGPQRARGN